MKMTAIGIYFDSTNNEVFAKTSELMSLPEGKDWLKVASDPSLGLLAIKGLLERSNLTNYPSEIYWHGMNGKSAIDRAWASLVAPDSPGAACFFDQGQGPEAEKASA